MGRRPPTARRVARRRDRRPQRERQEHRGGRAVRRRDDGRPRLAGGPQPGRRLPAPADDQAGRRPALQRRLLQPAGVGAAVPRAQQRTAVPGQPGPHAGRVVRRRPAPRRRRVHVRRRPHGGPHRVGGRGPHGAAARLAVRRRHLPLRRARLARPRLGVRAAHEPAAGGRRHQGGGQATAPRQPRRRPRHPGRLGGLQAASLSERQPEPGQRLLRRPRRRPAGGVHGRAPVPPPDPVGLAGAPHGLPARLPGRRPRPRHERVRRLALQVDRQAVHEHDQPPGHDRAPGPVVVMAIVAKAVTGGRAVARRVGTR